MTIEYSEIDQKFYNLKNPLVHLCVDVRFISQVVSQQIWAKIFDESFQELADVVFDEIVPVTRMHLRELIEVA